MTSDKLKQNTPNHPLSCLLVIFASLSNVDAKP